MSFQNFILNNFSRKEFDKGLCLAGIGLVLTYYFSIVYGPGGLLSGINNLLNFCFAENSAEFFAEGFFFHFTQIFKKMSPRIVFYWVFQYSFSSFSEGIIFSWK